MGDWADFVEAFGGRVPEEIARAQMLPGHENGKRRMSVTFTLTRAQKKKYAALGGASWIKKCIDAAPTPPQGVTP